MSETNSSREFNAAVTREWLRLRLKHSAVEASHFRPIPMPWPSVDRTNPDGAEADG